MTKKLLGLFTTIVAALAVVGVAWASGDDGASTSVTAATETSASVSADASTPSSEATVPDEASTSISVGASTSTSADASTSTSVDDDGDDSSTTSTSLAATTSTSVDDTTSTSVDDKDHEAVRDGVTTHIVPGVGTVTIEVSAGQLILVDVTAAGWTVEHDKVESDRIELEFTNALDAEAEFRARINDGRVEVRVEVESD